MILVLLGTQNNRFHRLLEEIERLVIVQAGYTKYITKKMKIFDFMTKEELEEWQNKADLVITHGGVGSILQAITKQKKVIAIPRLHEYGEHVNDHQKEIVELFHQKGYIIGIQRVEELQKAIQQIDTFEPKRYQQNHDKMLKIIEDFIEQN